MTTPTPEQKQAETFTAHGQTLTRKQALTLIWRHTHRDSKGTYDRSVLVNRAGRGTCLVALDALTDTDITDKLPHVVTKELLRTALGVVFSAGGSKSYPKPSIIDRLYKDGRTAHEPRLTLEEVRREYPDAVLLDSDEEASRRYDAAFCKPAKRITAERFDDALNVLPPCRWVRYGSTETFHVSELVAGNVASIYCRILDDYFELDDLHTLSHEEIVKKCKEIGDKPAAGEQS